MGVLLDPRQRVQSSSETGRAGSNSDMSILITMGCAEATGRPTAELRGLGVTVDQRPRCGMDAPAGRDDTGDLWSGEGVSAEHDVF